MTMAATRGSTTWGLPLVVAIALVACPPDTAAAAAASAAIATAATSTVVEAAPASVHASSRLLFAERCQKHQHHAQNHDHRRHRVTQRAAGAAAASESSGDRTRVLRCPWWATTCTHGTPVSWSSSSQSFVSLTSLLSLSSSGDGDRRGARRRAQRRQGVISSPVVGFVASPAPGACPAFGREQTCSSSSSSSSSRSTNSRDSSRRLATGPFGGAGEAGAWRGRGERGARLMRQQRPSIMSSWGRRSTDAVVVNGGTGNTEYYSWTETDSDIEVRVPLPPGTAAKSVQLSVTKTAITLGLRGREGAVLKGSLKGQVQADESHWTMEEMEDTGEKVLYLCLEKAVDMAALAENSMPGDWEGVMDGEEVLNLYYPDKDKDFDVDDYVKRMGYDRERDIGKVDKAMFSHLTAEMKQSLETTLPKSAFTGKDDMIPVMADPKVSPVIDTGVLGLPPPPSRPQEPKVVTDDAEVLRDESWAAGFAPDLGGADAEDEAIGSGGRAAYSPAGFKADAEFDSPVQSSSGAAGELTERQREISAGLRNTYQKLVKRGMINASNPDGSPAKVPDMDEMARAYETEGFMFKDGDFTEEELSKYMDMDMGIDVDAELPNTGIDLSDPAVRAAFGLD